MAATFECDAYVLRLQDYRDSDRLVWLITAERGRLSAIARGARKSRQRFGGHLDLFQEVRVHLSAIASGGLHGLLDCRALAAHAPLRADVGRYAAASLLAELASHLSREEAPDEALFTAVGAAFRLLAAPAVRPSRAVAAAVVLHLLTTAGFVSDLGDCVACRATLREDAPALLAPGARLLCGDCAHETPGGRALAPGEARTLAAWQRGPLDAALTMPAGHGAAAAAFDVLHDVLGRPLRAETFLSEILR